MDPRTTVVVMTRDRRDDLCRTLGRHSPPVIVVDNGSTDGTPELVRGEFPDVELVALGDNLGAPARNAGVALARTPYVAFADDDSWWEPGALERAADLLDAHPEVGLVAGRVLVGDSGEPDPVSIAQRSSDLGRVPGLPGPSVLGFVACGAVLRRTAFQEAGGFDPVVFFSGEEERLSWDLAALGWQQVYADDVVARHLPSPQRDRRDRRALTARNSILTAVMRRPWPVVGRRVLAACRTPGGPAGMVAAVPRLPAALRHRRRLPSRVESRLRVLAG